MRDADRARLRDALIAARAQTLALTDSVSASDWRVPMLDIVNPPLWELGHVGWFQERWCLRHRDDGVSPSIDCAADRLYDSSFVAHDTRWDLPLPGPDSVRGYLARVLEETLARLAHADAADLYFYRLALLHEYMHIEAFTYTWQTLSRPGPALGLPLCDDATPALRFDAARARLGSEAGSGFVFDNEKWAHPVALDAFEIDAYPLSNRQFCRFVEAGGYHDPRWWDQSYMDKLRATGREMPSYWRRSGTGFEHRQFDRWVALDPNQAVVHLSAFEAEAYCRWAGRSLPSEAQWFHAASHAEGMHWGRSVWEWTASVFEPFDGFSADPYVDYSVPWFGSRRVLKGGAAATPPGLVDARYRNFFAPERHDVFAGFRTCAALAAPA